MRYFIGVLFFIMADAKGQELFVFTEPASNMASHSFGGRLENHFMNDKYRNANSYMLMPELMWGASGKLMLHGSLFFSNMDGSFYSNGGSLFLKYRFLSIDEVHNHFRMALFGRYSVNNSHIHQYALDLNGRNSGYEGGIIATQLVNRVAISANTSAVHAMDNIRGEKFLFGNKLRNAINYSLSGGVLILPKEYTSYKQVNMNLMLEFLGQSNLHNGYSYIDMAPSMQFIFNSRLKIDIGYRFPVVKKLYRYTPNTGLFRLEYSIFNVY